MFDFSYMFLLVCIAPRLSSPRQRCIPSPSFLCHWFRFCFMDVRARDLLLDDDRYEMVLCFWYLQLDLMVHLRWRRKCADCVWVYGLRYGWHLLQICSMHKGGRWMRCIVLYNRMWISVWRRMGWGMGERKAKPENIDCVIPVKCWCYYLGMCSGEIVFEGGSN